MNTNNPSARVLFNLIQGSEITQESSYDVYKRITGGTEEEFLEFLRTGPQGEKGDSAYKQWTELEGNNDKTFAEFIEYLKGEKGDAGEVGARGLPATISIGTVTAGDTASVTNVGSSSDAKFDFVIPKGDAGESGKSAYQIWLDAGNSGTEDEFLASLKGQKGDTGSQGEQGPKGDKGDSGEILKVGSDYSTATEKKFWFKIV